MTRISKKFTESFKMLGYSIVNEYPDYFILKISEDTEVMFSKHLNLNVYIGIPLLPIPNGSVTLTRNSSSIPVFINKLKCLFKNVKLKGDNIYIDVGDDL